MPRWRLLGRGGIAADLAATAQIERAWNLVSGGKLIGVDRGDDLAVDSERVERPIGVTADQMCITRADDTLTGFKSIVEYLDALFFAEFVLVWCCIALRHLINTPAVGFGVDSTILSVFARYTLVYVRCVIISKFS